MNCVVRRTVQWSSRVRVIVVYQPPARRAASPRNRCFVISAPSAGPIQPDSLRLPNGGGGLPGDAQGVPQGVQLLVRSTCVASIP